MWYISQLLQLFLVVFEQLAAMLALSCPSNSNVMYIIKKKITQIQQKLLLHFHLWNNWTYTISIQYYFTILSSHCVLYIITEKCCLYRTKNTASASRSSRVWMPIKWINAQVLDPRKCTLLLLKVLDRHFYKRQVSFLQKRCRLLGVKKQKK